MTTEAHEPSDAPDVPADDAVIGRAFRWSLLTFVVLAVGAGAAYWWSRRTPPPAVPAAPVTLPGVRDRAAVAPPNVPLTDVTAAAGLGFVHQSGAAGDKLLPETMGGGGGFFDYDGDGDQDLLLVNSNHWPGGPAGPPATAALYENDGAGKFRDVTAGSGLDVPLYGMGPAFGDYDGDGDVDVYLTAVGPNMLFRNDGGGKFSDVTNETGVAGPADAWGTSAGFFDYDGDGDLDLFVCNYVEWSRENDLAQDFRLTGGGRAYGRPQNFGGAFSLLFRNDGGTFADVSGAAGIHVKNPATGGPVGKSLGVTFADFDADGRLDVFVSNDTVQNFLFHNNGDGTFEEIAAAVGVAFGTEGEARGAMGVDVARLRGDVADAVAIGNFANEMTALYVSPPGQMQFTDEAVSNGLGPLTRLALTFGVCFLDVDFDGRPDLLTANGHLEKDISVVQASQRYEQPPELFWNAGPDAATEFVPLTAAQVGPAFGQPIVGRGASYADVDGDGDLDLLLIANGGPARLFRNDQALGRHWLRLRLVGAGENTGAVGASVAVEAGGAVQRQTVMPTRSYLSQVELPVTFGLGTATEIDRVTIRWPSGRETTLDAPAVDREHVVREAAE